MVRVCEDLMRLKTETPHSGSVVLLDVQYSARLYPFLPSPPFASSSRLSQKQNPLGTYLSTLCLLSLLL